MRRFSLCLSEGKIFNFFPRLMIFQKLKSRAEICSIKVSLSFVLQQFILTQFTFKKFKLLGQVKPWTLFNFDYLPFTKWSRVMTVRRSVSKYPFISMAVSLITWSRRYLKICQIALNCNTNKHNTLKRSTLCETSFSRAKVFTFNGL